MFSNLLMIAFFGTALTGFITLLLFKKIPCSTHKWVFVDFSIKVLFVAFPLAFFIIYYNGTSSFGADNDNFGSGILNYIITAPMSLGTAGSVATLSTIVAFAMYYCSAGKRTKEEIMAIDASGYHSVSERVKSCLKGSAALSILICLCFSSALDFDTYVVPVSLDKSAYRVSESCPSGIIIQGVILRDESTDDVHKKPELDIDIYCYITEDKFLSMKNLSTEALLNRRKLPNGDWMKDFYEAIAATKAAKLPAKPSANGIMSVRMGFDREIDVDQTDFDKTVESWEYFLPMLSKLVIMRLDGSSLKGNLMDSHTVGAFSGKDTNSNKWNSIKD